MIENKEILKSLNEYFGSYKAEWLNEKIYDFFTEPTYFLALKGNQPCVLQGGRGTGKTTVLKGLSYQGQYALLKNLITKFDENKFIGIYHKVDTNHVRAFTGGGLSEDDWKKLFGHYFNLIICRELLFFIKWHGEKAENDEFFSSDVCRLIAKSLHLNDSGKDINFLYQEIELAMYNFQSQINNISNKNIPLLSMQGDPIKLIIKHVIELKQYKDKMFYILLDEYENLTEYQQQCINTLIKHNTNSLSIKVGVRELGWRTKHTLNVEESLTDPADYFMIDIEREFANDRYFDKFAQDVCQQRIVKLFNINNNDKEFSLINSLISLNMEEEAIKLGIDKLITLDKYNKLDKEKKEYFAKLSSLYQFFLIYWADVYSKNLSNIISEHKKNISVWNTRFENYKYSMLFKIKKGRGMGGIQKYYSGWKTFIKLANGNIRYLMQLVYRSYEIHIKNGNEISSPVSPKIQTIAARETGSKNMAELEGLCKNGTQLTKILFGFGRVFNLLISENNKKAPEINQFVIKGNKSEKCNELLRDAVMYLACIRITGNKPSDKSTTKDYMYALHPIFAPFFVFSHRKKRKIEISEEEFLGIISDSNKYIKNLFNKGDIITKMKNKPEQKQLDF